jgi:hypothetical protein
MELAKPRLEQLPELMVSAEHGFAIHLLKRGTDIKVIQALFAMTTLVSWGSTARTRATCFQGRPAVGGGRWRCGRGWHRKSLIADDLPAPDRQLIVNP